MTKLISFDTETTGLVMNRKRTLDKQPWCVELYAERIDVQSGEQIEEFHSHFKPGVKLEKEAAKVTGLTDEFLSDKPLFGSKIDQIAAFFDDCDILLGQNIMFDITMLSLDFERCNRKFDVSSKRFIDTVEQCDYIFGYRPKLGDLYEHLFGERFDKAHEASADVKATTRIFLELYRRGDIEL